MRYSPAFHDFDEMRARACKRLPHALFEYIDRGTEAETALSALHEGFGARRIVPRTLNAPSDPNIATRLFSTLRQCPFIIAPTALAGLVAFEGELIMARAAARAGVPFCVATQSSSSIDRIAKYAPDAELWFQLYVWRDREETWRLLERARRAGVTTLLLTVDTPASPKKVHNLHNGFGIPLKPSRRLVWDFIRHPGWVMTVAARYIAQGGLPSYAHYPVQARTSVARSISDPRFALETSFGADFLNELRNRWKGRLLVKGILAPEDGHIAAAAGCDGIVVSSHGGRNHDSAVTPLAALPAIRAAAGPEMAILADSGVRRGSDAAKLIGAGADGVLLGRAPLFGLAAAGQDGVIAAIECVREELRAFLSFSGVSQLTQLRHAVWQDER